MNFITKILYYLPLTIVLIIGIVGMVLMAPFILIAWMAESCMKEL